METHSAGRKQKKIMDKLPSLTIIIVSYNSERTLPRLIDSLERQDYEKKKLEILLVDGNSTDNTRKIASVSRLGIKIVDSEYPSDPEACRAVGIRKAKNEIIAFIDSDNLLPHKNWIKKMLGPFTENKEIYGTQTLRYAYRPNDSVLNRYFALLGAADPVAFYMGKADRLSYLYKEWNLAGKIIKKYDRYFLIEFNPDKFPTLGCNGFFFRRKIVYKTNFTPKNFFHTDTPLDLARKGYNKYAIVRDEIVHDTADSFLSFLKKRAKYMRLHYQIRASNRRYRIFDPDELKDLISLGKFIFFSITFVEPLIFAARGYVKIKDPVWFIHPIFCFSIFLTYTAMVFMGIVQSSLSRLQK